MKAKFQENQIILRLKNEGRFRIGKFSYGSPNVLWWGEDVELSIGSFCSIADDVTILLGGNHRSDWITTYPFSEFEEWPNAKSICGHPASKGDIKIGNDVWIGNGATILSGVEIGDGAIIGAKSVVAKNIPPYAVAIGNPVRIVKNRFQEDQIKDLLQISWWDWSIEEINHASSYLLSPDINLFISYAKNKNSRHLSKSENNKTLRDSLKEFFCFNRIK
ncbi:CatB-related O-acetyltransferase [Aureimonas sp. AU40]|uniref:CatB-related O-acetyltransferase n=1 Tax=Aureimonas sp. AU40 TaxID=1637747 RepID=UPI0009E99549|nr:CatB-related O-acetyltransferase [Aureimonas sp. AU40]